MRFFEASTIATAACITLADIAKATETAPQTLRRARMDPASPNYRPPPAGWQKALAKLAEGRARELQRLADELRKTGEE